MNWRESAAILLILGIVSVIIMLGVVGIATAVSWLKNFNASIQLP